MNWKSAKPKNQGYNECQNQFLTCILGELFIVVFFLVYKLQIVNKFVEGSIRTKGRLKIQLDIIYIFFRESLWTAA